ncbi:hypothetical protein MNBD_NITROSPINAE03-494 [hydrothermal vent metagenome]|uniref:Uncharacterized protein n=1 Tax=hydrothermal vent metagenome TaxID=652676 RepID=A0A3B1BEI2_9ZZZZ
MKLSSKLPIVGVLIFLVTAGCTSKKEEAVLPATTPDKVVLRFFDLIAEGGKLTTMEAMKMISPKTSRIDLNTFRKWTQEFSKESKVKIVETIIRKQRDKDGNMMANVRMEVLTPSIFGGDFTSTSNMNLILNEEANKWEIDFLAQTVNEDDFLKAPKDARAVPLEPEKSEAK